VAAVREHQPGLVFLTSPNNPTGTALPLAVIEAVCEAAPGMVVVDEAYAEFAREGAGTALDLLPRYPRLAVTRTMSKAFALAGARVGYLAADPAVIDALLLVRLPYHLSAQTQATARAALAHAPELLATVADLRAERDRPGAAGCAARARRRGFGRQLRAVRRVRRLHAVWQGLLDHGVLVREGRPARLAGVSIGAPAEMGAFRDALTEVLGNAPASSGSTQ
jgi:histidinol-phosphate aminotransferase